MRSIFQSEHIDIDEKIKRTIANTNYVVSFSNSFVAETYIEAIIAIIKPPIIVNLVMLITKPIYLVLQSKPVHTIPPNHAFIL